MNQRKSWHQSTTEDVLQQMESGPNGLDDQDARQRQQKYGRNKLPEPPRPHPLWRFVLQFHNILIYVLLGAALITGLLQHYIDTGVILAVVLINAIIGVLQEGKAERAMDAIRQMLAPKASVMRNGKRTTLAGEELVPGDIVMLEAGDKVPADLRLIKCHDLQIQEAILTGESVAVEKQTDAVDENAALGDRTCLAFSGTTVASGQGVGVVVAIGEATEIGRISEMLTSVETLTTPLVAQMGEFSRWLTAFIVSLATIILGFGYFVLGHEFAELFMSVVALSVSAIPEGLPAVLTITLAVGVQAMARRNAIIRRLPAIETIGAVSVICSDKTGTLTRNEMSVTRLLLGDETFHVSGEGYAPDGELSRASGESASADLEPLTLPALAALLCNDAELTRTNSHWQAEGDPMEAALLALAAKILPDGLDTRREWTRTDVIPFDSRYKFMASLHHNHDSQAYIFIKGAPEQILQMCSRQLQMDGNSADIDSEQWLSRAEQLAEQGQRVLALAMRKVDTHHTVLERSDLDQELIFLGLTGLIDPPRSEAITAVKECHEAGINVKMITGDHATTAGAIARQIGLTNTDRVITGRDIDQMDDAALAEAVRESDVFARTSPEHKLRLVQVLQAQGKTVAMTGDGVNDAPALKRADAGIAMGLNGSAAAREASELVLADDNFASIASAVREGRTVYDNIKKVISWTLPTNAGEAGTILLALALGMSLPITPLQILWVNMITAVTLGIALAFEPTEANTMKRPPRSRQEPLLNGALVWHIILVGTLFLLAIFGIHTYAINQGYSEEMARTLAMNTLVVMKIFHLFFIRNIYSTSLNWRAALGTKAVWLAVILVTLGQFAITYLPILQTVFETEAVALPDGMIIIALGVMLFVCVEIEKQLRIRFSASGHF
jgi:magnesium-transporting ATPase (P-type)